MSDFNYLQKTFTLDDVVGMTEALHDDGFALIPGVLSLDEVKRTRDAIDNLTGFGWDSYQNEATDHFKNVFNRDRWFLELCDKEPLIGLAESTMGSECHIIGQSAWRSRPGHKGWSPHTDRIFVEVPEKYLLDGSVKPPSISAQDTIIWMT